MSHDPHFPRAARPTSPQDALRALLDPAVVPPLLTADVPPGPQRFQALCGRTAEATLGQCAYSGEEIAVPFDALLEHALVLGRSGSGKSKLLQQLLRCYRRAYCSAVLIDAEGDLSEDAFADVIAECAALRTDAPLPGIHYLRPSWDVVFGLDPFDDRHVPHDPTARRAWLATRVRQIMAAVIRSQNETTTEGMPRLERVLTDCLTAIGLAIGPNGARLPLANIFVLLHLDHPRHDEVYAVVAPHLPDDVRADFAHLRQLRADERLRQTESTINRLRSFLSPLVAAMVSHVRDQTINLQQMIAGRGVVLFNLKDTEYLAPEQADVIGRILVYLTISAVRNVSRAGRVPCALIVDECQRFLNRDMLVGLAQGRKWGLSTILATQTLAGMDVVEENFGQVVLGAVNVAVCFEQRLPQDLAVLGDYLFRPNLSFEEFCLEVDRHRGYEMLHLEEHTRSWQTSESWGESHAAAWSVGSAFARSRGVSRQQSDATALSANVSDGTTHSDSRSAFEGTSHSDTHGQSGFEGQTPIIVDGQVQSLLPTQGFGTSQGTSDSKSQGRSASTADGASHAEGQGLARILARIFGVSDSTGVTASSARSGSTSHVRSGGRSSGGSISSRKTPLAIIEPEVQPQGRLRRSVEDQLELGRTLIATLPARMAVIRRTGQRTRLFRVAHVDDPFPDPAVKEALVREYERKLHAIHPYFIVGPRIDPQALDAMVDRFLDAARGAPPPPVLPPPDDPFR